MTGTFVPMPLPSPIFRAAIEEFYFFSPMARGTVSANGSCYVSVTDVMVKRLQSRSMQLSSVNRLRSGEKKSNFETLSCPFL